MNVSRRGFILSAAGLLVPEPERVVTYSFLPGEPDGEWETQPEFEAPNWLENGGAIVWPKTQQIMVTVGENGDFRYLGEATEYLNKAGGGTAMLLPGHHETFHHSVRAQWRRV